MTMFGGQDGLRRIMSQDTLKPKNLGETLARFGGYFKPYWPLLLLVAVLITVSTWTQVTTPDLVGQAVDCYLVPAGVQAFGGFPGVPAVAADAPASNCWLAAEPGTLGLTQGFIQRLLTLGGFPLPDPASMDTAVRLAGLGRLILIVVGLFVAGAVLTGMTFFTMTYTGQQVLRAMRL